MSVDLSHQRPDRQPLCDSFAELRQESEHFEQFVAQQLDQLYRLSGALADREQWIRAQEERVQRETQDLTKAQEGLACERETWGAECAAREEALIQEANDLDQRRGELETLANNVDESDAAIALASQELTKMRQELEAKQSELERRAREREQNEEAAQAEVESERDELQRQLGEAMQQIEKLENDRQIAHGKLEAAQENVTALEAMTARQAKLERELAAAKEVFEAADVERRRLREQAQSGESTNESELEKQLSALREEHAALELELETVRNRAAELAETADEEKRKAAEERAVWMSELKELRRSLAMQSEILSQNSEIRGEPQRSQATVQNDQSAVDTSAYRNGEDSSRSGESNAAPVTDGAPSNGQSADPVIESVMAQFEMIQRDRIRRQKEKRAAKTQPVSA